MPTITGLSEALSANNADLLPVVQGGETKQISADKISGLQALGVGQVLKDVTAERVSGVIYTNPEDKPIIIYLKINNDVNAGTVRSSFEIDGVSILNNTAEHAVWGRQSYTIIVPTGSTYKLELLEATGFNWFEFS